MQLTAFSGSARNESINRRVLAQLLGAARDQGATVTELDLRSLALPLYDGDLEHEQGLPTAAVDLRSAITGADGLLIACPEYNGYPTPLLLNALDWATRGADGTPDLAPFRDKVTLICSTSPGALAGLRAVTHLRTFLSGIGAWVMSDTFSIPRGFEAFDEAGEPKDPALGKRAAGLMTRYLDVVTRLS